MCFIPRVCTQLSPSACLEEPVFVEGGGARCDLGSAHSADDAVPGKTWGTPRGTPGAKKKVLRWGFSKWGFSGLSWGCLGAVCAAVWGAVCGAVVGAIWGVIWVDDWDP